jgi:anti-anti-sigma factor
MSHGMREQVQPLRPGRPALLVRPRVLAGPAEVSLAARPGHGCTIVQVSGALHLATSPQLRTCVQQAIDGGASIIVLDLAGVRFVDSSALGAIVRIYKELHRRAGRLCLAAVRPSVLRVFQLTSVDRLVRIYDSVEAAEADVAASSGR